MEKLVWWLFLLVNVHPASASHSLEYLHKFPESTSVGLVDGEEFVYYDGKKTIPKAEWTKKILDEVFWKKETNNNEAHLENFKKDVKNLIKLFNQTEGVHKVQLKYGCELHEDGPDAGFWQYRYDEDVFINFDLNTGTWMATKPIAVTIKKEWETEKRAGHVKSYLKNECAECLSNIVRYRRSTPESKGTASHSLQYFFTAVTPGINFPEFTAVGLVDGEQIVFYDSNIRKMIPKTEWMEKNEGEDYWTTQTQKAQGAQEIFKVGVETLMQRFNQTDGVHTVQWMYGCELHDDGTKTGYNQYSYDGEDFLSLDLKTLTWTAANDKAVTTKQKWEGLGEAARYKNYMENECIDYLKKYVDYSRSTLERKVSPEASLFQKDSSSPVVCHATGFFPKAVMISWQKNGEDLHEDVELRETLLNQDGTFQKRSVLTVSSEELKENQYSCVIHHSSLEKDLVMSFKPDGGSVGIIIGAVVAVLLLVLIGCVGVFFWKKKQSGFKPVSGNPNAPSEGDSSSNNS